MPAQPRVLIVEDEIQVRRLLHWAMDGAGWRVHEAPTASRGLSEAALARPDVIVLDLGLPDMDGTDFLRRLREWSQIPVVVLSVRDGVDDKIAALDAGADDYVQKPFDTRELLARIRAVQRRSVSAEDESSAEIGALKIDYASHTVTVASRPVRLTPIEFSLLKSLVRHAGKVVTQRHLLREVWGPHAESQHQYLRVHMTHIRRKLSEVGLQTPRIVTESGIGYRLTE
jgi:two-component system KDP operon response regulator KdpE